MVDESSINELCDREAIRQIPILYCHYVRNRNIPALLDLFVGDCEFIVERDPAPGREVFSGHQSLQEFYESRIAKMDPWPFIHNHVVELTGEGTATGFVYAEVRSGAEQHRVTSIGVYADEYVKTFSTKWKFKSRKFSGISIPR